MKKYVTIFSLSIVNNIGQNIRPRNTYAYIDHPY